MSPHVCVKCQAQYQPKKNSVTVVETAGAEPKAYRLWSADLMECPICHAEMVCNFSHEPMIERHEAGFAEWLKAISPERRFVMHNPAYLAQKIGFETKYVRSYAKPK